MPETRSQSESQSRERIRLGLCCLFVDEPSVRFRTTTARNLSRLSFSEQRAKLLGLTRDNAEALRNAVNACVRLGIESFRVQSGLLPLATHPDHRYGVADLAAETLGFFREATAQARVSNLRLSFHPDQFVLLSSPNESVTAASLLDLELHGDLAELLGADAINIHAGGAYGDKAAALDRLAVNLGRLSDRVRSRLTFENDDRTFHVRDLLPLCRKEGTPLTYDVHHHRCHPDGLSIGEASTEAAATWNREPLFHISSPKDGWDAANPRSHSDMIDPADFPQEWRAIAATRGLTVDVEAKAKEKAVLDLKAELAL